VTRAQSLRTDFAKAVARLDEALALPKDSIVPRFGDPAVRFEISFELCWKFLKTYLEEEHNAACTSPRTCFRAAFRHGIIDDDPFWIDLTVLRNCMVHTYNQELAEYVYSRLADTARRFRAVLAAGEPR
jgi:nucleotidyltransferase substrate binding protein (TIGR01987 family)